jgi:hypothetical protein
MSSFATTQAGFSAEVDAHFLTSVAKAKCFRSSSGGLKTSSTLVRASMTLI